MAYDGVLKFDTSMDAAGFQKGVNGLDNVVKGAAAFKLLEKGLQAVSASIDSAVSRYDTLNRFSPIMQKMGYSAESADTSIKKLSDGIQGLPTTLDSIVGGTQRLAIATGSLDKGTETALALNNALYASGASSEAASRGTEQYIQALSRGKIDAMEWKTLMETMPYAMQEVAKSFGFAGTTAVPQLQAALSNGEITMAQFNDKLIQLNGGVNGFAEVAKTATGGIGTAWTNFQTAIVRGTTSIITAIDSGLSQTRFKSIENIIVSTGKSINSALQGVASVVGFTAKNFEILAPPVIGVVTAFKAYSIIGTVTTAFKGMRAATAATNAVLTTATLNAGKDAAMRTVLAAAIAGETTAEAVRTAAKKAGMTIDAAGNLITAQGTAATTAETASVLLSSGALSAKTVITGVLTGTISLATAAQWLWNAAMAANPIGLLIAGAALLVGAIIAVIAIFSRGSEEYRKQKEEVKALAEAQEQLADSMQDSEGTFTSSTSSMEANAKVAQNLVRKLKDIGSSSDSAEDKHRRMANTVKQLNSTVDGLNIAYDKETGAITNLNTGQEISIEQLEELVSAKAELARANAWAERANDLVREQVKLLEEQEVILNKIDEINENAVLPQKEKDKLIKELTATYDEYGFMVEDVQTRIDIANDKVAESDTEMAESVVASHEHIEQAVTSTGDSIEDVAARWGVSVDEILAAKERDNISLDEWVSKQQTAWEDYEASIKERTEGVVNSFKAIPAEYDKSAQEMLEILINNKTRYAEWETAMEEITRQLGPTAAEEFAKLGPEATSAMQEILGSAELLDQYRETFGVKIDEATGLAVENWNDPNFIGAPSTAIDSSAQMVAGNTSLDTAMTGTMENAHAAAESVDFTDVGQTISTQIVDGLNSADVSGAMNNITAAIQGNTGKVTSAITSMSTAVQTSLRTMSTQAVSIATQMMTNINSAVVTRTGTVKSSVTSLVNGIVMTLDELKPKGQAAATQMMTNINSAVITHTATVKSSATALVNGVISSLEEMVAKARDVANRMMDGMYTAMQNKAPQLYALAQQIANNIAATIAAALEVHSPSRVMIRIFENVMLGAYEGMDGMSGMLYNEAEEIADGIAERLTIADAARTFVDQLRSITDATPLGGVRLVPQGAYGGAGGGVQYTTSLTQNITTPKPLSASEMTQEGQDLLKRSRWQLP